MTKNNIIEHKKATLQEDRRGGANWLSYVWTQSRLPELKEFIESQTHVPIVPGDIDFTIQKNKDDPKDPIIKPYFRDQYLNKITIENGICVETKILDRVRKQIGEKPGKYGPRPIYYIEVLIQATAIHPNGAKVSRLGYCSTAEPGRQNQVLSNILGMAETRATNRAERAIIGATTSAEEMEGLLENQEDLAKFANEELVKCPSCGAQKYSKLQKRCLGCRKSLVQIQREARRGKQ